MRDLVLLTTVCLLANARAGLAQCSDGTRPPCRGDRTVVADPGVIAILPFRVSGADPSLAYLRDGIAELLAVEFNGEGGPRAIDPSTTLRAWANTRGNSPYPDSASAIRIARALGAGQVLIGAVVGSPRAISMTARILGVPRGDLSVPTVRVEGSEQNLGIVLDQLAARLLSRRTGAWRLTSGQPGTVSLEALRSYVDGRAALRRLGLNGGKELIARALELDSSFVLAAYWVTILNTLPTALRVPERSARLAWNGRERLGSEQRLILETLIGPKGPGSVADRADLITALERVVDVAPASAEAWSLLGDSYFHYGKLLGYTDWLPRARRALTRSVQLDTLSLFQIDHLATVAVIERDMAAHARWLVAEERLAPTSGNTVLQRYSAAAIGRDSVRARTVRDQMARFIIDSGAILFGSLGIPQRELTALVNRIEALGDGPQRTGSQVVKQLTTNGGQPSRAAEARRRQFGNDSVAYDLDVLNWVEADSAAAERLARLLSARRAGAWGWQVPCEVSLSRLRRADTAGVEASLPVLRASAAADARTCAELIAALADALQPPSRLAPLLRADSTMRTITLGPALRWNYDVAAGFARQREYERAAATVRRRFFPWGAARYAISLRDEGRWAALAGDTATAVRAFREYLVVRENPEPALVPERDSVRAQLARLTPARNR